MGKIIISTISCGHLFISPIFPTKIFISKKIQVPQYSNGGPLRRLISTRVLIVEVGLWLTHVQPTSLLYLSPETIRPAGVLLPPPYFYRRRHADHSNWPPVSFDCCAGALPLDPTEGPPPRTPGLPPVSVPGGLRVSHRASSYLTY